jgi:putative ABC transport system permease protein
MKLLRTLILRPLVRDGLRTALTILAVALGVAVVVAIDLAGDAATGSFRSSMETLAGKTDLEILANGGIDETWIGRLDALRVNTRFAPVIEMQVGDSSTGPVPVYGLDLAGGSGEAPAGGAPVTRSPALLESSAIVSEALAKRLRVRAGDRLTLTIGQFTVERVIDANGAEFIAIDIAAAQKA